ncbi:MAG: right-handed parallel beta-helix repeat-containing protein, partial [Candidatus Cloacimonetes bacterium]|nr:right-handed parallel beta-helix repeat-containing protein [Candidatus Cloacimonadota bacterium]
RLVNVTVVGNNPGGIWCSYDSDPIIENSNITDNIGAGICCTYSSSPSLYYVTISGNSGGGITCSNNSNIILENVKICDNSVWGGIYSDGSTPTLTNVTIIGNSTDECGGGISLGGGGVVTLRNVKIIGNTSGYDGGGIYAAYGDQVVMLINVLVANNYAWNSGGGINIIDVPFFMAENVTVCDNSTDGLGGGIMCQLESDAVIKNSIVWNNSGGEIVEYWTGGDAVAVYYSDVRGGWSGPGSHNINSDPLFSDDDYRLSEDSPCIDTGSADTTGLHLPPWDLDGNVRIWDGNGDGVAVIDMGVYEYGAPVYSVNEPEIPEQSTIHNYPNPFTTSTTISFYRTPNIHEEAQIEIYNLKGQKIKTLTDNQIMKGGNHEIMWDGTNSRNKRVGSGIYFIKLRTEKSINVKKIVKFGL